MNRKHILLIAILIVVILSIFCFIFPDRFSATYASVVQALALFLGFALALKVASIYGKELRKSFLFLSFFLLLYMLSSIIELWNLLYIALGNYTIYLSIVICYQLATYAMLISSCLYTLKVINVKRINRYGWIFLAVMLLLCVYIVIYGVPSMMDTMQASPTVAIMDMVVRVLDMIIVLMLVPVVLLYLQYLRAKAQESVTFTFIMGGLIFSLLSTYIFQLVVGMPLLDIRTNYYQQGTVLDSIYTFSYLIMVVGLYANMKYDQWGFRAIERSLG